MLHISCETQGTAGLARRPEPPKLPPVTFFKGRGYVLRSALNAYKRELVAASLGAPPVYLPDPDPDPFVPLKQVCVELGVGRRTIGRRIKEASASVSEPAAA
jgi:hypothetical protein